jgi:hypothetical protein
MHNPLTNPPSFGCVTAMFVASVGEAAVQRSHQKRSGFSRLHCARRSLFSPIMMPKRIHERRSPSSQAARSSSIRSRNSSRLSPRRSSRQSRSRGGRGAASGRSGGSGSTLTPPGPIMTPCACTVSAMAVTQRRENTPTQVNPRMICSCFAERASSVFAAKCCSKLCFLAQLEPRWSASLRLAARDHALAGRDYPSSAAADNRFHAAKRPQATSSPQKAFTRSSCAPPTTSGGR